MKACPQKHLHKSVLTVFSYSGYLHSNRENVFQVLASADHLQIKEAFIKIVVISWRGKYFSLNLMSAATAIFAQSPKSMAWEVAEKQMAWNYQNICENEKFLTHISTEKLMSHLCRDLDDLTAPSETFVFKSVMKWINWQKNLKCVPHCFTKRFHETNFSK